MDRQFDYGIHFLKPCFVNCRVHQIRTTYTPKRHHLTSISSSDSGVFMTDISNVKIVYLTILVTQSGIKWCGNETTLILYLEKKGPYNPNVWIRI
ncbi:hypothetical protein KUTeg_012724 [Tegillarca granosa]|uniref:Uncharacterized protein n=1 Tax=Tegillarca granosa TaxID=220873 RepID=A0ABQ9F0K2_TEGGR|nr:hypothetical protein KUTeg_012724 [Tegillarca granosa]